jgi:hypothetical protein
MNTQIKKTIIGLTLGAGRVYWTAVSDLNRSGLHLRPRYRSKGFALVATLLLLALLVALIVALMALVRIETRTASLTQQNALARHNALTGLEIAIGNLQKNTGPDTRITAPANIYDENFPDLVGVWKSWEGLDHDPNSGRPITPDYSMKEQGSDEGDGRFITWLVSGAIEGQDVADPSSLLQNTAAEDGSTVPLLAHGSLGAGSHREVHVPTQSLGDGAYAWWVSPENQKARIQQPHKPKSDDLAGWLGMMQSSTVPDPEVFNLGGLLEHKEAYNFKGVTTPAKSARRAATRDTLDLLADNGMPAPALNFHDLSVNAVGLLTNVATGGWRKDLSILSERYEEIYQQDTDGLLPLFRKTPQSGAVTNVPRPSPEDGGLAPAGSLFYPWSEYPPEASDAEGKHTEVFYRSGASSSWLSLLDFATSYKYVDYDSSTMRLSAEAIFWPQARDQAYGESRLPVDDITAFYKSMHESQRHPVMARLQFVFFARAFRPFPSHPYGGYWHRTRYQLQVMAKPVVTLWNPYSVELVVDKPMALTLVKSMPFVFAINNETRNPNPYLGDPQDNLVDSPKYYRFAEGTKAYGGYDSGIQENKDRGYLSLFKSNGLIYHFPDTFSLGPGECKTFSTREEAADGNTGVFVTGELGYDGSIPAGWISNVGGDVPYSPANNGDAEIFRYDHDARIYMRFDNYTQWSSEAAHRGPGFFYTYGILGDFAPGSPGDVDGSTWKYIKDYVHSFVMVTNEEFANSYWKTPVDLASFPISDIAIHDDTDPGEPQPTGNPPWTPIFSIVLGPRLTVGSGANNPQDRPTKGLLQNNPFVATTRTTNALDAQNHPINSHYEFAVHAHPLGGSDTLPEDSSGEGYMMTGVQVGDGLSQLVLTEFPAKPLASLVDLQHWNLQGGKPLPPYQYFVIGNSHAIPMLPKDHVVADPDPAIFGTNLVHDDSYCANHLLFDDWFFSSISPEVVDLGQNLSASLEEVYRGLLEGDQVLQNRAYRLSSAFTNRSDEEISELVSDTLDSADGWMKVASQLEVDGMFNINSTSVKAWRALLGRVRKMDIYHHSRNGIVAGETDADYVFSRTSIPGDVEADPLASGAAGSFPGASEFSGFRKLSDADLDELAEGIVGQIRLRGPFLSLSEFINRKLEDDDAVAMMGAVQTALSALSSQPNGFLESDDHASQTIDGSDPLLSGIGVYENDAAATGYNTYGLPGYTTQADILRPLAPLLAARDDTFTIRAYGDARDAEGNLTARAWCEAVVQRVRNYVDPSDAADTTDTPASATNRRFGRQYIIKSFRWLNEKEV